MRAVEDIMSDKLLTLLKRVTSSEMAPAPADAMSDLSALVVKCKWGDVKLDQIIEWSPAASPSRSRSPTVSWGGTPLRSRY